MMMHNIIGRVPDRYPIEAGDMAYCPMDGHIYEITDIYYYPDNWNHVVEVQDTDLDPWSFTESEFEDLPVISLEAPRMEDPY